jgi:EF hand
MKTLVLAALASLAMAAPVAVQAQEDGRQYEEPNQGDAAQSGSSKGSKWYTPPRAGFDRDSSRPGFEDRRGRDRDYDRYHYDADNNDRRYWKDDGRENWLDGEAFALLDRWALLNFDYDRDGRLSRREYENSQRNFWNSADRNRDGRVSNSEYRDFRNRYLRRDFNQGYASGWHNGWRW